MTIEVVIRLQGTFLIDVFRISGFSAGIKTHNHVKKTNMSSVES